MSEKNGNDLIKFENFISDKNADILFYICCHFAYLLSLSSHSKTSKSLSNNAIFIADNFLRHSTLPSLVCTFVCTSVSHTKNSFFIIIITLCLRLFSAHFSSTWPTPTYFSSIFFRVRSFASYFLALRQRLWGRRKKDDGMMWWHFLGRRPINWACTKYNIDGGENASHKNMNILVGMSHRKAFVV